MAVDEGLDVDDDLLAHVDAAFDRRRAHVRQQHDIVELEQLGVDRRLVLEDVEAGAGDLALAPACGSASFSSITSPRAVLTMMACGRSSFRRRADSRWKVAGRVRAVDRDDVHPRQHLVEAFPVGRLELLLDRVEDAAAVVVVDRQAEAAGAARQRLADAAHADDAEPLAPEAVAEHEGRAPAVPFAARAPAARPRDRRRATARISAIVMSAVSSVRTPGVLVTVMPRWRAVARSIWSTPVPNEAISLGRAPAWASTAASIRSVTVGTSTSACLTAATSCAWLNGVSSRLRRVVEQLHHPRLDHVGQLARDDDQRLLLLGHRTGSPWRLPLAIPRPMASCPAAPVPGDHLLTDLL